MQQRAGSRPFLSVDETAATAGTPAASVAPAMESIRVLVIVEDAQLADLLMDALADAGHQGVCADAAELPARLAAERFDAAIVDLDTRGREAAAAAEILRRHAPSTTVVALLPCGGLPSDVSPPSWDLSLEKPTRLQALLSALESASRN